jgi:hypothetical protein
VTNGYQLWTATVTETLGPSESGTEINILRYDVVEIGTYVLK